MELELEQIIEAYRRIATVSYYQIFIASVLIDVISGFAKSFINKEANSTKGLLGVIKHLLVVLLVLTVAPYLTLIGAQWVSQWFLTFFIASYGISIVENYAQLGLPMPDFVKQYFEKLLRTSNEIDLSQVKISIDEPKKEDNI